MCGAGWKQFFHPSPNHSFEYPPQCQAGIFTIWRTWWLRKFYDHIRNSNTFGVISELTWRCKNFIPFQMTVLIPDKKIGYPDVSVMFLMMNRKLALYCRIVHISVIFIRNFDNLMVSPKTRIFEFQSIRWSWNIGRFEQDLFFFSW